MKKILTLFMATVVAMSMMAIPQVKKAGNKTKPVSHEQFEAKTPAQVKVKEMHKASLVERAAVRPASAKKVVPATIAASKKIANSVSEVITLHFDGFSVLPEWYEESGDWYMACADAEGWIVKFDILNPSYVGTFTTEDFDLDYSYMYTPDGGTVYYASVECTITEEKKSEHLTVLSLEATIEGTDGNTYVVTCVHKFLVAKEVIENTISDATLEFDGYSEFVLAGKNEVLDLNLDVYATWPVGRFTKGECNMENTKVLYNGVEQDLNNPELVVTTAVNEEGKAGYAANLSFYNQDTAQHVVEIFAPLAEPTDTVEIQMNNLQVDDSWAMYFGWVYYTAIDSNWDIYAGVAGFEAAEGTWSGEDVMLYVTNQQTGEDTEAIYAKATVVEDEEKGWMATFEGVCVDGKYYVVNMHFEIPEPTKTVELRFENSAKASFYPDMGNDLMLSNDNGDYYIALDIYNVPMGSEFTLDQMDTYYTQLVDWNNMVEIQIADVQGVVYQRNDTTFMEAQVIGFDAVLYDVVLWHTVPTPSEVVELTVDAVFDNQIENQGYYTLHGQANESELLIAMSPLTWEVEGTYVNDGMFGGFGTGEYDFYANYTYVAQPIGYDEYGDMQFDVYSVEKGTLTVTMDEENNILAHASVICSNGVQYEIEMTSVFEKPHLEYDAEYGVERIYTTDDVAVAEYDADYGMAFWQVEAADGSDVCALYFFLEEADAELVIPEGEYAINDSWDYGTVLASTGYDPNNGAAPSLYATYTEDGYLNAPLWFMVDGTVTVKHVDGQLSIEVNALNSYDQEIHIVYNGESEEPQPEYYEDVITNMVFDLESMTIIGGPSQNFQIDVYLPLGEDNFDGSFTLSPESSVAISGQDATFIEGIAYEIDPYAPAALVDLVVEWGGSLFQFHLTMSAAPMEATVVVVEDAQVEIEKYLLFGDTYDYALKMTGNWFNEADGLTYPVLVEVPVYYPEATEPTSILSTVTVGGWGDEDPWLGFGEGELTVTTVDNVVTATGIVENPMSGIAIDITISGTITPTGVEDATVTVKPAKTIKNGQLIIVRDGKEFNAQGAVVK